MTPAAKPQGVEIMLRSMGLGDVLDMSKRLASEGTVEKILAFANGLDTLNETLARLCDRLDRLEAAQAGAGPDGNPCPSLGGPGGFPRGPGDDASRPNGADR